jgi:hypothetical protein
MRTAFFLLLWVCSPLTALWSDVVECENGDRYNGKVILVDDQTVKLQNEIAGVLNIPRVKVSTISFRTAKTSSAGLVSGPVQTNLSALSPNQALKFDASAIEKVQNEILGNAGPEANQMFKEMMSGLMSGKLDVGDVRLKAQDALKQLKELQKELGDDDAASLLGSYGAILESFLKETPPPSKPALKTVTPVAPADEKKSDSE